MWSRQHYLQRNTVARILDRSCIGEIAVHKARQHQHSLTALCTARQFYFSYDCAWRSEKSIHTSRMSTNEKRANDLTLEDEGKTFQERLASLRYSPAYLRHAPPTQYYSSGAYRDRAYQCATGGCTTSPHALVPHRHRLLLLDNATCRIPGRLPSTTGIQGYPHSHGVYVLSSTAAGNIHFESHQGKNASSSPVHSTLMGLPTITAEEELQYFIDIHHAVLSNVSLVCLPEITLSSACVLKALSKHFSFQIVCSEYGKEFLQNSVFYEQVLKTVWDTHKKEGAATSSQQSFYKWLRQEGALCSDPSKCSPDKIWTVPSSKSSGIAVEAAMADGSHSVSPFLPLSPTTIMGGPQHLVDSTSTMVSQAIRPLRVQVVNVNGDDGDDHKAANHKGAKHPSLQQSQRREGGLMNPYTHRPIFFYDQVFRAVFVGNSMLRIPWLPHVLSQGSACSSSSAAYKGYAIALPGIEHARWSAPSAVPGGSTVMQLWNVRSSADAMTRALRAFSAGSGSGDDEAPQRVLCAQFGELPGNVEEVIAGLEETTGALLALQGRLHHFLSKRESTVVKAGCGEPDVWVPKLQEKLLRDVICGGVEIPQKNEEIERPGDGVNAPTSAPRSTPDFTNTLVAWSANVRGIHDPLRCLCECLFQAACGLPPPAFPTTYSSETLLLDSAEASAKKKAITAFPADMRGSTGVALLCQIFAMKNLTAMVKIVEREEIDVSVFIAMTKEELQKVFKPTFGVLKRFEGLQDEIKRKAAAGDIVHDEEDLATPTGKLSRPHAACHERRSGSRSIASVDTSPGGRSRHHWSASPSLSECKSSSSRGTSPYTKDNVTVI